MNIQSRQDTVLTTNHVEEFLFILFVELFHI